MYHLKLCKALSYDGYGVHATQAKPDVSVDDGAIYHSLLESGYFVDLGGTQSNSLDATEADEEVIEVETSDSQLHSMTVSELKTYASNHGIDISGATKKDDIIARIEDAEKRAQEARDILRTE